jgi:hypothetical protein
VDTRSVIAKVKEWSKALDPEEQALLDSVLEKGLADEELEKVAGGGGSYFNAAGPPQLPDEPAPLPPAGSEPSVGRVVTLLQPPWAKKR